jgi:Fe-S-cluster containining protein
MNNYNLLETNLSKIKRLAEVREDENYRFRSFLKGKDSDKIDRIVHRLHDEISGKIDCLLCGNCCSRLAPRLDREEVETLALLEDINPESYIEKYCELDFGEINLETIPCRYWEDNKCSIYEHRPKECRLFPYTRKDDFISKLYSMIKYYKTCPIVFNLMERLKNEMRFRRG